MCLIFSKLKVQMKKPSDALFRLAKAMTPSEKRYFHQYARRHVIGGQNNYLALFQLLSKQEAYDEEALKEALPGPGPASSAGSSASPPPPGFRPSASSYTERGRSRLPSTEASTQAGSVASTTL